MPKRKQYKTTGRPDSRKAVNMEDEKIISDIEEFEARRKAQTSPKYITSSLSPSEKQMLKREIEEEEMRKRKEKGKTTPAGWSYEKVKRAPRKGSRVSRTLEELKKRGSKGMTIDEYRGGVGGHDTDAIQKRKKVVKERGWGDPWGNVRQITSGTRSSLVTKRKGRLFYTGPID